jgi:hypothetical protein
VSQVVSTGYIVVRLQGSLGTRHQSLRVPDQTPGPSKDMPCKSLFSFFLSASNEEHAAQHWGNCICGLQNGPLFLEMGSSKSSAICIEWREMCSTLMGVYSACWCCNALLLLVGTDGHWWTAEEGTFGCRFGCAAIIAAFKQTT